MRTMLMLLASYHLWLHWRPTAVYLGSQFLDFEPGIHYLQPQMQSGTTGINTLRIYSLVAAALDFRIGIDYPAPIVDHQSAVAAAKERRSGIRCTAGSTFTTDAEENSDSQEVV